MTHHYLAFQIVESNPDIDKSTMSANLFSVVAASVLKSLSPVVLVSVLLVFLALALLLHFSVQY